jgi:hypothetical protein
LIVTNLNNQPQNASMLRLVKHGAPVAITATAHRIARIIDSMLKPHYPYHDPGAQNYDEQQQQRLLRNLQRQAKKLSLSLVPLVHLSVS